MTRPSKRTIISRQAKAIHKRRRLAEAESQQIAEPVFPGEVENEGEAEEDDEAEEDKGDRRAMHQSLQTYINTLQVHNGADSESEAAPLPEQPPQTAVDEPSPISQTGVYESGFRRQTRQQKWPRVSNSKRVEILKAGMRPRYHDCLHR
jgi:hypothetical protein